MRIGDEDPFPLARMLGGSDNPFPLARSFRGGQDTPFPLSLNSASRANPQPASRVVQAEVIRLNTGIPSGLILAVGEFPTGGWSSPRLLPVHYIVDPSDGIYDFDLVATPPEGLVNTVLTRLTAVSYWPVLPPNAKGVRIRSSSSPIVAMFAGGQAMGIAGKPEPDYRSWIGKRLVRSGEQSGGPDVLREEDIPDPHRIFTPTSTKGDMMYNPQRINLWIDDKMIVTAVSRG
jgi:hypothetical protein